MTTSKGHKNWCREEKDGVGSRVQLRWLIRALAHWNTLSRIWWNRYLDSYSLLLPWCQQYLTKAWANYEWRLKLCFPQVSCIVWSGSLWPVRRTKHAYCTPASRSSTDMSFWRLNMFQSCWWLISVSLWTQGINFWRFISILVFLKTQKRR